MNTTNLSGKLIGVKVNGAYYNCQTDAKLTLGTSLTKNPICKPNPGDSSSIPWETSNVDSKNWSLTFSGQSFLDSIVGFKNQNDLTAIFVNSDLQVEAQFLTNETLTDAEGYDHDFIYEGPGILSGITLNAPGTGGSTYDVTITGNGPLTDTLIPSTT